MQSILKSKNLNSKFSDLKMFRLKFLLIIQILTILRISIGECFPNLEIKNLFDTQPNGRYRNYSIFHQEFTDHFSNNSNTTTKGYYFDIY